MSTRRKLLVLLTGTKKGGKFSEISRIISFRVAPGTQTKLAGLRVIENGNQKVLVELKGTRILLHHLPHGVQKHQENGAANARLDTGVSMQVAAHGERMAHPQPLLLNEHAKA